MFVGSITVKRDGLQVPAQKVGFFRLDRSFLPYTATCTCRSWAVMAKVSRLERAVIDSGKGKSLFVCLTKVNHSHAPRNLSPVRPGAHRPNKPGNSPAKNGCLQAVFPPVVLPLIC